MVWTKLSQKRMEIAAPCGCVQAFEINPQLEICRTALVSSCRNGGSGLCEYNFVQLLAVALRLTAFLGRAGAYEGKLVPEPLTQGRGTEIRRWEEEPC
jgi:hypothetical protein